ncbi:MAG: hypothetical protein HeimC3_29600 [Candidatus Heimdallarchaeota archaeon LC_3]|nr:MAG: hypothetical protein HeimC3_29600 [Candidatus Heimdallarchaeota archaeon LC_3]
MIQTKTIYSIFYSTFFIFLFVISLPAFQIHSDQFSMNGLENNNEVTTEKTLKYVKNQEEIKKTSKIRTYFEY